MLTAKGKYGLKALVHLARLPPGETTQSQEIAEANNVPKKFLDAILGDLRNAGIVHSRKGPGGGTGWRAPRAQIKVGNVIRTLTARLHQLPARAGPRTSRATTART